MRRLSELWFRNLPIGGTMHLPGYMKDVHHADEVRNHTWKPLIEPLGPSCDFSRLPLSQHAMFSGNGGAPSCREALPKSPTRICNEVAGAPRRPRRIVQRAFAPVAS